MTPSDTWFYENFSYTGSAIGFRITRKLDEVQSPFQKIEMFVTCMNIQLQLKNCNVVGDIFEDVFYQIVRENLTDFEQGPKQASPDYYGDNKQFEFELKTFTKQPGFDIGNFTSYISQLCEENGLFRKILNTKYLIFEYMMDTNNVVTIKKFYYLNVWNLVSYTGKYPISMQVKKNMWYNIRPDSVKNWNDSTKTFHVFIEQLIQCINMCHHIEDKQTKILNIKNQYTSLISKYTL